MTQILFERLFSQKPSAVRISVSISLACMLLGFYLMYEPVTRFESTITLNLQSKKNASWGQPVFS